MLETYNDFVMGHIEKNPALSSSDLAMLLRNHAKNKEYFTGKQINDYLISKVKGKEDILVGYVSEYLRENKQHLNEITLETTCQYLRDRDIEINTNSLSIALQNKEKVFSRMKYEALNAFSEVEMKEEIKPKLVKVKKKKKELVGNPLLFSEQKQITTTNTGNTLVDTRKNLVSFSPEERNLTIQVKNDSLNFSPKKIINLNIEGLLIKISIA